MHSKEHILREVLGPRPIGGRSGNQCEYQILVGVDELLERSFVAPTAPFNELVLVDRLHPPLY
jgi:hypothetical protein